MAAAVDKMKRRGEYMSFTRLFPGMHLKAVDTEKMLNEVYDNGGTVVLEGTQGTLLDLHLGDYPYVTSRQTHASAWLAEAGLAPTLDIEVIMVVRTFPIRVAGNSGPFPSETDWVTMATGINAKLIHEGMPPLVSSTALEQFRMAQIQAARGLGMPTKSPIFFSTEERAQYSRELSMLDKVALESLHVDVVTELKKLFEMTTVTKKLRRIAMIDEATLKKAARINRPTSIALTFFNYAWPEIWGVKTWDELMNRPGSDDYRAYLAGISRATGARVEYLNTSATTMIKVPENAYEWKAE